MCNDMNLHSTVKKNCKQKNENNQTDIHIFARPILFVGALRDIAAVQQHALQQQTQLKKKLVTKLRLRLTV